ncbi:MAG: hypothetical protein ABIR56_02295, partial [Polaromonas sp.]
MDTVGNQPLRLGQDAGADLANRQHHVDAYADPGAARGGRRALSQTVSGVFGIIAEVVEMHGG